jgi:hypothetical protein
MSVSSEPRQELELLRPTPDPCNMVAQAVIVLHHKHVHCLCLRSERHSIIMTGMPLRQCSVKRKGERLSFDRFQ